MNIRINITEILDQILINQSYLNGYSFYLDVIMKYFTKMPSHHKKWFLFPQFCFVNKQSSLRMCKRMLNKYDTSFR